MKHALLLFYLLISMIPVRIAVGQATEEIQQQYHRAETAWRNRSSLLEAKVRVDQVLEEAPNHADALKLRAEVLMAMRRYKEALVDARKAIEFNPNDGSAYLVLAEAARLNADNELARESLEEAGRLSINEGAAIHLNLAESAMRLGEQGWTKAESFARVAHAKEPDNVQAYYLLARIFILQNRTEAGATILEKGFRSSLLDPDYIRADSILQKLADHSALIDYF